MHNAYRTPDSNSRTLASPKLLSTSNSSDDEILPSPFTSNFLKTCSSSAISAPVLKDEDRIACGVAVALVNGRRGFETHQELDLESDNVR
ncbi:hypothetical protein M0R45_031110 [Rubus argutus]|uniref:Uncharacterized protein n=1 Tax=Rubus argutus TaxID=59490 RepID=A0AAW1WCM6_RUBAR